MVVGYLYDRYKFQSRDNYYNNGITNKRATRVDYTTDAQQAGFTFGHSLNELNCKTDPVQRRLQQ